ncbi:DUF692 domain-containing protein [Campylobacter blaseri]|uniref:Uncharacterized protein n=1 Tax=Campylobacter blaseri TaxID=2042961 RepID=A0A2P8R3K4_9BACT|nr:DUF692 family multinuclear iron-containing protein [Campylobacter blaseri]PSM53073.1 hypothetical protein CQ405_00535 [Campylobacter blaseri]PSM54540.1 hypothetical protein CRN67_00535 [Campylobacter blaseri]QKF86990.1 DUF692 domain-containing protein [Campylobacter blaseri]
MEKLQGCGLGLRREFLVEALSSDFKPDFWEITPENWIQMPYHHRENFEKIVSQNKIVAHGVSLSIGSNKKPSKKFLKDLREFLDKYNIKEYSEHISFSHVDFSQSYELLPICLNKKSLNLLNDRVNYVQDELGRKLILENATYYYKVQEKMSEVEFINKLVEKSGVGILLDVNNVYVNSVNHNFDAQKFIDDLDKSTIAYIHIAGHFNDRESGFLVDTHGKNVTKKVWELLAYTLEQKKVPCMIERDNNIPSLDELGKEFEKMKQIYESVK